MFTDIVDYSKMVQKDQSLTLELVEEHNQIIKGNIENFSGNIIKFTGDGFMAEFDSSISAVAAAIAIQKELSLRNETQPDKRQITIRIGIHTGDVIHNKDDLVGDGVNIASRIEGISPHGGIAVSQTVFQSVKNEKNIYSREVGKVFLKNINEAETIYKIYNSKVDYMSESEEELIADFNKRGIRLTDKKQDREVMRVGVIYIKNMGGEEDNYLCHGITSDLISEFSKINEIQTPLLSDMLKIRDFEGSIEEIGKKLNVEYLIEGILSTHGNKCQISVQLVDCKSSNSLWSEKFEISLDNIQMIMALVIEGVLKTLNISLPDKIKSLIGKKSTDDPIAYEFYLKGLYYNEQSSNRMEIGLSRGFFKKAFQKDETFIPARYHHAMTYNKEGKHEIAADYLEETLLIAQELKDESSIATIYNCFGILYKQWGKFQRSIIYYKKALKIETKLNLKWLEGKTRHNLSTCYININQIDNALKEL